jgi:hypothetical protein
MAMDAIVGEDPVRQRAIKHLRKRRDFFAHLLIYLMVNGFLVAIWATTSSGGFFWPMFPIVLWGIGLVMNAWDAFRDDQFGEDAIRREMSRIERHG